MSLKNSLFTALALALVVTGASAGEVTEGFETSARLTGRWQVRAVGAGTAHFTGPCWIRLTGGGTGEVSAGAQIKSRGTGLRWVESSNGTDISGTGWIHIRLDAGETASAKMIGGIVAGTRMGSGASVEMKGRGKVAYRARVRAVIVGPIDAADVSGQLPTE